MRVDLTRAELDAISWAVGQYASSNANDVREMMTNGMSRSQANAMNRAEFKIRDALGYRQFRKAGESER